MTIANANSRIAERDPVMRPRRPINLRNSLARIPDRISTPTRWIISAAVGLITPAVLIAENAMAPLATAMACFGNGSLMTLAAAANAFTMIP